MVQTYRGIVENGVVRLLDAVDLPDGTELRVVIDQHAIFKMLMGDLPIQWPDRTLPRNEALEADLADVMRDYSTGQPLSELIIEERNTSFSDNNAKDDS